MADTSHRDDRNHPDWQHDVKGKGNEPRTPPDRREVERRAYERFQERGREDGRDQEDWFEAEREARQRSK